MTCADPMGPVHASHKGDRQRPIDGRLTSIALTGQAAWEATLLSPPPVPSDSSKSRLPAA